MPIRLLILVASLFLTACGSTLPPPAAEAAPPPGPHRQAAKNTSPAPDVQPEPANPFVRDTRAESVLAQIGLVEARIGQRFELQRRVGRGHEGCLGSLLKQLGELEHTARARRFDLRAAAFDDPVAEGALFAELARLATQAEQLGAQCAQIYAGDLVVNAPYAMRLRDLEQQVDDLKDKMFRSRASMVSDPAPVGVSYHGGAPMMSQGVFFGGNNVLAPAKERAPSLPKPKAADVGRPAFAANPQAGLGGSTTPVSVGSGPPPVVAKPPAAPPGNAAAHDGSMLLRSAQLTLAVFEVDKKMDAVQAVAVELGGYLALRGDRELTVRVPRERFDEALKRIEGLGDVLHRSIAAEDVTDQYVDLELRLKNAEAVRARLEKLLENASVKDAVEIHKELAKVTEEIERLSGKLKLLRDRIAFSTITVAFERTEPQRLRSQALLPFPWMRTMGLSPLLQVSR